MNIFAQDGFGPADKLQRGLTEGLLAGAILSPRYARPERMRERIVELRNQASFLALDPEFYAAAFIAHPTPNLGTLEEWQYFRCPRRRDLISGAAIPELIEDALRKQVEIGLEHLIAPNVYIQKADSIDSAVALNFLNNTQSVSQRIGSYPVYGTLALHRDVFLDSEAFRDILDSLTGLSNPPEGYYVIIGSDEQHNSGKYVRSDLFHSSVIAGLMYINYILSLNGFRVINGYSFLLAPLLAICGASAIASGWSSGLRKFCLERYVRSQQGGRHPNIRYVSNPLMSHVLQTSLDTFRAIEPQVMNGNSFDEIYLQKEPTRTEEALQSWSALCDATAQVETQNEDLMGQFTSFLQRIAIAKELWSRIQGAGLTYEAEANFERLETMEEGISLFLKWAELT